MEAGIADRVWDIEELLQTTAPGLQNHFRDVEESLSERSNIESQQSCRHLILSDTLIPRSFSLFSA
jgi:hypothetical protein